MALIYLFFKYAISAATKSKAATIWGCGYYLRTATIWGVATFQINMVCMSLQYQELMNRHSEKEWLTSVPILCRITLQNAPYKDYKLLVLTSFEVTTVTMDSQEPACCDDGHLLAS